MTEGSLTDRTLLLIDDDAQSASSTQRLLEYEGYTVFRAQDGVEGLEVLRAHRSAIKLVLTDVRMPRMDGLEVLKAIRLMGRGEPGLDLPVILMTGFGCVEDAVFAMKWGAVDFLTKPVRRQALLETVSVALRKAELNQSQILVAAPTESGFIGESPKVKELLAQVAQVAPTAATVLICGESGTGKELIAREIHRASARAKEAFIALNCAALPENLIESELFGFEKGAFTGAQGPRVGLFEAAHRGTLFLDEIGEMPLGVQAKLLRVLQNGEVRRVGATGSNRVDSRVIAATHRDLRARVKAGLFREDLLYRLEVVTLETPPLRERPEDLRPLVSHFLKVLGDRHGKKIEGLDPEARLCVERYSWPGNIRELGNVLERAVVLLPTEGASGARWIGLSDLPENLRATMVEGESKAKIATPRTVQVPLGASLKEVEDLLIQKTLELTEGNKEMAAKILGVNPRTIYRKLDQLK